MDSVLKLRVVEDAYHILDDEDLDELDKVFRSLLDDTTTPTIAAQALTDHIAENAKSRVQKLSSVSEQQRQEQDLVGPVPLGDAEGTIVAIVSAASSVPPGNKNQDRLLELLQCLNNMEPVELPQRNPPDDEIGHNNVVELWRGEIWTQTYSYVWDWFCNYGKGKYGGANKDVANPHSEAQTRWRNIQAFLSRMTMVEELWGCTPCSALFAVLPDSLEFYERKDTDPAFAVGYQTVQAVAAAQWLAGEERAEWVYMKCHARPRLSDEEARSWWSKRVWCMQYWEEWKKFFARTAEGGAFHGHSIDEDAKAVAKEALSRMQKTETKAS